MARAHAHPLLKGLSHEMDIFLKFFENKLVSYGTRYSMNAPMIKTLLNRYLFVGILKSTINTCFEKKHLVTLSF